MNKLLDESYYDFIVDNTLVPDYNTGDNVTYINELHSILNLPTNTSEVCDLGQFPYHRFPSLFTLSSIVALDASNITQVQTNPFLSLFGQGVLVGVIDTGIDYVHPAFRRGETTSKIYSIWDQTIGGDTPPEGFTYGTEYTRAQINLALSSENPLEVVPTVDENGHGTAIASIIAGTPTEEESFIGIVPDADLVVVKLKEAKKNLKNIFCVPEDRLCYQETDVMLGIRYLTSVATKLNRPIAICIAFGTSQGGHDGSGATSTYMNRLSQTNRVAFVVAAGNEVGLRRHCFINNTANTSTCELQIGPNDKMFSMEIWPYAPTRCSIELVTPTGETTAPIYPELNYCRNLDFIFNQSNVSINNTVFEQETGDQLILIRFQDATPGIWKLMITNLNNEAFSYHSWLPSGNLISADTFFIEPDPYTTVTSPGNARSVLTVAAYNQVGGGILNNSSRGYSRTDFITPQIAAPGYQIPCAMPNNGYSALTGTGAAAAHATGIVAMMLEWAVVRGNYPSITGNDIDRMVIRGARRNQDQQYPNKTWGYGESMHMGYLRHSAFFNYHIERIGRLKRKIENAM